MVCIHHHTGVKKKNGENTNQEFTMCQLQNKECCLSWPQCISVLMCEGREWLALFFFSLSWNRRFSYDTNKPFETECIVFYHWKHKKDKKNPTCTKPSTLMFAQVIKGILPLKLNHAFILIVQWKTAAKALEVISPGAKMRKAARVRGRAGDVDTCWHFSEGLGVSKKWRLWSASGPRCIWSQSEHAVCWDLRGSDVTNLPVFCFQVNAEFLGPQEMHVSRDYSLNGR